MRILVSNDDGIHAPGLKSLAQALSQIGQVQVIAPDRNRTGASNSLTLHDPIRLKHLEDGRISVEGTPTDCVMLALRGLLDYEPDVVVSGINAGSNLGDDVLYSGTVAAAMEGRFLGLPAIAVSLDGEDHYSCAAEVAKNILVRLMSDRLPSQTILNVNVPDRAFKDIRGYQVTRLGNRQRGMNVQQELDPRGLPIYWMGKAGEAQDSGPGTDFAAIREGFVSITPLNLDLTHYRVFDQLSNWAIGLQDDLKA